MALGFAAGSDAATFTPTKSLSRTHPRLFGGTTALKALATENPDARDRLIAVANDGSGGNYTTRINGIAYLLTGNTKYAAAARDAAMNTISQGITVDHVLFSIRMQLVAECYDLCFHALTADERKAMVDYLRAMYAANMVPGVDSYAPFSHNTFLTRVAAFGISGAATYPENPDALKWLDNVHNTMMGGQLLPALAKLGQGGGWFEGTGYAIYSMLGFVEWFKLAANLQGIDYNAASGNWFRNRCLHEMFACYPGVYYRPDASWLPTRDLFVLGDGTQHVSTFNDHMYGLRLILANQFFGGNSGKWLHTFNQATPQTTTRGTAFLDLLYRHKGRTGLSLNTLKLSHLEMGVGTMFARSSWKDDASWLAFQCGDHFAWHQHMDQGSFWLYKNTRIAAPSGQYAVGSVHDVNYYIRTIAQNTITIYQPGETSWTRMRNEPTKENQWNDGGQANKWGYNIQVMSLDSFFANRQMYETGDMLGYQTLGNWTYAAGNVTAAYSASKCKEFIRQIVFLRPDILVVFDRVTAAQPSYRKRWLLHVGGEPQLNGLEVKVSDGEFISDGNQARVDRYGGRMFVRSLSPTARTLRKVGGREVKDYYVEGAYFPAPWTPDENVVPRWRIEIEPGRPQATDHFLTVIYLTTPSVNSMPATQTLSTSTQLGVSVAGNRVMFNLSGAVGGSINTTPMATRLIRDIYE